MRYKANAIGTIAPLANFFAIFFVVANTVPQPYKAILWSVGLAYIVGWGIVAQRLVFKYRTLILEDEVLIFPKRTIKAEELSKIRVFERNVSCLLYFKGRKYPLTIAFRLRDQDNLLLQLRGWSWRNGVTIETVQHRKKHN